MKAFKKIYCAYHKKQFITNFCVEQKCVMPLCPSCVVSHNEFHKADNSRSTYSSVEDVLAETYDGMVSLIKSFESEQRRIETIVCSISQMPSILRGKFALAKKLTLDQVQVAFQRLERVMLLEMCEKHQALLGPDMSFLQTDLKVVTDSLKTLQKMVKAIDGEKCLATVIKFMETQQEELETAKNLLTPSIDSMQWAEPQINIDQAVLQHIDPLLKRFISLGLQEPPCPPENTYQIELQNSVVNENMKANSGLSREVEYSGKFNVLTQKINRILPGKDQKPKSRCDQEIENLSRKIAEMRRGNLRMEVNLKRG